MHVGRADLERSLAQLAREAPDARAGIFGPDTVAWRVLRESIVFLGGGRAALLQLAHPFVAHAVDEHSHTRTDPFGRFQRTFAHVFAMAFGERAHAERSARRVHAIHERIAGELPAAAARGCCAGLRRYDANDAEALFWVHATLFDSALRAYELVLGRLELAERERYYGESCRFARLFGIPDAVMPPDWAAFERYLDWMIRNLVVTPEAQAIAGFLFSDAALRPPGLARVARLVTAGLMPEPLRAPFGLPFGPVERRAFEATLRTLRATYRRLPGAVRFLPAYARALRRLAGRPERDGRSDLVGRARQGVLARGVGRELAAALA
ncbi:MAG: DUF2236 domain-containing protein [Polyangiaceae bacterium]|nr:DUF2236 domain-containing protein [Polyangiaceae bacterium]